MSKSKELIPKIQEAQTKEEAIKVLYDVLEALHLSNNYTDMVKLKDDLATEKERYQEVTKDYEKSNRSLETMIETRMQLNFLFRDINDKFSFEVNKLKIYYEERKTSVRGEAMKNIKDDKEVQKMFKATSTSAIRDIMGLSPLYVEYIANYSISYGLYKELETLLTSIRMFIDLLAGEISREKMILNKDAK